VKRGRSGSKWVRSARGSAEGIGAQRVVEAGVAAGMVAGEIGFVR
jgi:hypothetical protein